MVIGKPTSAGIIPVILTDNELIPANLNSQKTAIFRQGATTGRELKLIKALGTVLEPGDPLLRAPAKPVCNYTLDPEVQSGPLHQHTDGTWWFYEATWNMEQGPYVTSDEAIDALTKYCIDYQNSLTKTEKSDTVKNDETPNPAAD